MPGKTASTLQSGDDGPPTRPRAKASTTAQGTCGQGALDGDRFSIEPTSLWKGRAGDASWWWQVQFPHSRDVGAILQVHGDHEYALRNAPKKYIWQTSQDGKNWADIPETATSNERRIFRIHRLDQSRRVRWLRIAIADADGDAPALRDVEFFASPRAEIPFPPWAIVVSTTGSNKVPGEGAASFRQLARSCNGWDQIQFQNVWLGDFQDAFTRLEPQPLCGFLSGNFIDWCQQKREYWRGTAEVLKAGRLPLWASCGGAQGLAILAENGVDQPWDCPQCRDPEHPRLPIYTHVAGSIKRKCGDYSGCVFERGPCTVQQVGADPVFQGLPREFPVMESHCGQIEWPPRLGADRDLRRWRQDEDPVPPSQGPPHLCGPVPHRAERHLRVLRTHHEELPRPGPSREPPDQDRLSTGFHPRLRKTANPASRSSVHVGEDDSITGPPPIAPSCRWPAENHGILAGWTVLCCSHSQ